MPEARKLSSTTEKTKRLRSVYLDQRFLDALDEWRSRQDDELSRSAAIRRLGWRGIKADAAETEVRA